jgi:hypothetical protein
LLLSFFQDSVCEEKGRRKKKNEINQMTFRRILEKIPVHFRFKTLEQKKEKN